MRQSYPLVNRWTVVDAKLKLKRRCHSLSYQKKEEIGNDGGRFRKPEEQKNKKTTKKNISEESGGHV